MTVQRQQTDPWPIRETPRGYLRQAMLMSQSSLGKALGRSDQSVAVWEKRGQIPKFADSMLRVLFAAHTDGDEKVKNIVHALNDVDRAVNIIMKGSKKGWTAVETQDFPPTPESSRDALLAA